jgi:hypothetical protein
VRYAAVGRAGRAQRDQEKIARDGKYVSKAGNVPQEAWPPRCRARRSGAARAREGDRASARWHGNSASGSAQSNGSSVRSQRMPPVDANHRQTPRPGPQDDRKQHRGYPPTLEKTRKIQGQLAPQRRHLSCDYTLCGGFHAGERGGGADELTTRRRRRYVL